MTRINHYTIIRTMDICKLNFVSNRGTSKSQALPLTRSTVVRQIVKHIVDAVSPQQNLVAFFTFYLQCSIYIKSGILMKIKFHTWLDCQCGSTVYLDASIYDNRFSLIRKDFVYPLGNYLIFQKLGIPGICIEVHLLLYTTLKQEYQIVFYQIGRISMLQFGSKLNKHPDTISLAYFHILSLKTRSLSKISTIYIDSETILITTFQSHRLTSDTFARAIINPHGLSRCRYVRECCVQTQRIHGKRQHITCRCCKTVIIYTRGCHQSEDYTYYIKYSFNLFHYLYNEKIPILLLYAISHVRS